MGTPIGPCQGREMTDAELGWVAGLLEGEGSFMRLRRHSGTSWSLRVAMQSTDRDVVERLLAVTGVGTVCSVTDRPGRKPCWQWATQRQADCAWLMLQVHPLMSSRRQRAIAQAMGSDLAKAEKW